MSCKPGDRVRDLVTGFTGIVIARTEYLFGCVRVQVQPEHIEEKDGKKTPAESFCFDEDQVEVQTAAVHAGVPPKSKATTGGPGNKETTRAADVTR